MSWLDSIVWIPAALTAVALCAFAFNEKQRGGPLHVPWLSFSGELPSLSSTNLSLIFLSGVFATAFKAVEEYACPRAAGTTEFNQMLRFLNKDARQRVLDMLLHRKDGWPRFVIYVGPVVILVIVLGLWTHAWEVSGGYMWVHTVMIGRRGSRHTVGVALLMCRECIQQFIDEMIKGDWKQAPAKHQLIDEHMESLFSGILGMGVVAPRLVRDLVLGCMAGVFMVLVTETSVKLLALAVLLMCLCPFALYMNHLASVTDLCNRTSPRLKADHIKAAAHMAAAQNKNIDREDFLVFLQYLSSAKCGVMIGGVLVTKDLVTSVFVKIATYLPLLLGILQSLQR